MNDKVMKFVSYANTSMKRIRSTSPKSAVASQNILTGGSSGSSNSASGGDDINYDAPSLANAVGSSAKVGSFAQRICCIVKYIFVREDMDKEQNGA